MSIRLPRPERSGAMNSSTFPVILPSSGIVIDSNVLTLEAGGKSLGSGLTSMAASQTASSSSIYCDSEGAT